jgi:hypothetical protein
MYHCWSHPQNEKYYYAQRAHDGGPRRLNEPHVGTERGRCKGHGERRFGGGYRVR